MSTPNTQQTEPKLSVLERMQALAEEMAGLKKEAISEAKADVGTALSNLKDKIKILCAQTEEPEAEFFTKLIANPEEVLGKRAATTGKSKGAGTRTRRKADDIAEEKRIAEGKIIAFLKGKGEQGKKAIVTGTGVEEKTVMSVLNDLRNTKPKKVTTKGEKSKMVYSLA